MSWRGGGVRSRILKLNGRRQECLNIPVRRVLSTPHHRQSSSHTAQARQSWRLMKCDEIIRVAPTRTNVSSDQNPSNASLAINSKPRPAPKNRIGRLVLCRRKYAGSKLESPNVSDTTTKHHSIAGLLISRSPTSGSNPMIEGMTAQCTAQSKEAATPKPSSTFFRASVLVSSI
jgi:hypothetical protein